MSNSKFLKGVLWGAVAGGALSLLDRTTRQIVLKKCQRTAGKVTYYVKHPVEAVENVKESTQRLRTTIEEVGSDVTFLSEKINELREITPQVTDIVKETKEVLFEDQTDKGEKLDE